MSQFVLSSFLSKDSFALEKPLGLPKAPPKNAYTQDNAKKFNDFLKQEPKEISNDQTNTEKKQYHTESKHNILKKENELPSKEASHLNHSDNIIEVTENISHHIQEISKQLESHGLSFDTKTLENIIEDFLQIQTDESFTKQDIFSAFQEFLTHHSDFMVLVQYNEQEQSTEETLNLIFENEIFQNILEEKSNISHATSPLVNMNIPYDVQNDHLRKQPIESEMIQEASENVTLNASDQENGLIQEVTSIAPEENSEKPTIIPQENTALPEASTDSPPPSFTLNDPEIKSQIQQTNLSAIEKNQNIILSKIPLDDTLSVALYRPIDNPDKIGINLEPAGMGEAELIIEHKDQQVIAIIRSEKADILDMLRKEAASLEKNLMEQGLDLAGGSLQFEQNNASFSQENKEESENLFAHNTLSPSQEAPQKRESYEMLQGAPLSDGVNILV